MKGTIIGDIIGSRFEFNNVRTENFELFTKHNSFTDDTICTIAVMDAILTETYDYKGYLLKWCRKYPNPMGAYGGSFARWIFSEDPQPYNSFGNGAAMRVSPVAWAFDTPGEVISQAIATASVTHNHPEGIKGAIATVHAIMTLRVCDTPDRMNELEHLYYDPSIRYKVGVFDETCQGTVPVALRIMRASQSFEDAIRTTMRWGGDSDTLGAIVGGMAEAYFGVPEDIWETAKGYLPDEMVEIIDTFYRRFVL